MPVHLTRTRFLASLLWQIDSQVKFSYGDEDAPEYLAINADVWVDMGKPATITISIEPGDSLNEA